MWVMWKRGLTRTVAMLGLVASVGCVTAPQATQSEQPASGPPQAGEPFAEFAAMPGGPKAVADEGPDAFVEGPAETMVVQQASAGNIARGSLEHFMAQGPGYALQLVQVQPAFTSGRFSGFEVVALSDEGMRLVGGALQPGDVVVRINRRLISRPEDYMSAWESLKSCAELSLQIVRQGQPMELVWPVEG